MHRKQKDLARDLVKVFPINEFAIRTFNNVIKSYPESGEFVSKTKALEIIPDIPFTMGSTYTGEAIKATVKLLENERSGPGLELGLELELRSGSGSDLGFG